MKRGDKLDIKDNVTTDYLVLDSPAAEPSIDISHSIIIIYPQYINL